MAKKPDNTYGLFINGEFRDAKDGKFFDTYSPATKEKIASVAEATKEDVDDAVNAAWAAFDSWKKLDKIKRAEILLKIADVIDANKEDLAYIERQWQATARNPKHRYSLCSGSFSLLCLCNSHRGGYFQFS